MSAGEDRRAGTGTRRLLAIVVTLLVVALLIWLVAFGGLGMLGGSRSPDGPPTTTPPAMPEL